MSLPITPEMEKQIKIYRPYLNERLELSDDAPQKAKTALEEFRRLSREQEKFALSLW